MADVSKSENPSWIIEAPASTPMPMLAAAGITLAFAGLVTSFLVTAVGLVLAVVGFLGGSGSSYRRSCSPTHQRRHVALPIYLACFMDFMTARQFFRTKKRKNIRGHVQARRWIRATDAANVANCITGNKILSRDVIISLESISAAT